VSALEPLVQQAAPRGEITETLKREVEETEIRAGQLEVAIRVFGPGAGRPRAGEQPHS
jgi:hypothetical protein